MTLYKYEFKCDQKKAGYGGPWLSLNIPVTVVAGDWEEASSKAKGSLPPARRDTDGWVTFTETITEVEEKEPEPKPYPFEKIRNRPFRMRGIA